MEKRTNKYDVGDVIEFLWLGKTKRSRIFKVLYNNLNGGFYEYVVEVSVRTLGTRYAIIIEDFIMGKV